VLKLLDPHFYDIFSRHDFEIGKKAFYIVEILLMVKSHLELLNKKEALWSSIWNETGFTLK
jgi:hypothetical protein